MTARTRGWAHHDALFDRHLRAVHMVTGSQEVSLTEKAFLRRSLCHTPSSTQALVKNHRKEPNPWLPPYPDPFITRSDVTRYRSLIVSLSPSAFLLFFSCCYVIYSASPRSSLEQDERASRWIIVKRETKKKSSMRSSPDPIIVKILIFLQICLFYNPGRITLLEYI